MFIKRKTGSEVRKCKVCGSEFVFQLSQLSRYKGAGQYCSRRCHGDFKTSSMASAPIRDKYGRTKRKADVEWRTAVLEACNHACFKCKLDDTPLDAHHMATRASRPDLKHDVSNGIALCRHCHQWVHANPEEAEARGLLVDARLERKRLDEKHAKISERVKENWRVRHGKVGDNDQGSIADTE